MAKKKKKGMKRGKKLSSSLPEKFEERMETIAGPALFSDIKKTFIDKPTTFRVNRIKATREEIREELKDAGIKTLDVPWYKDAFILQNKSKRDLTNLEIYTEGKVYIQSLASMVPPLVLDPKPGDVVLDLTAAPGSKTSQIAAMMEKEGELLANELNDVRFLRLEHNMNSLGVAHDEAPGWDFSMKMEDGSATCREYPEYFDKILLDVVCSGEARFIEGVPKTYGYWSEKKIKSLVYRQQKLLFAAWSALKPGGTLVYSTCTMAPEENEMRISKLLERVGDEAEVIDIVIPGLKKMKPVMEWKGKKALTGVEKTLRILPTKDIESFFVAKIRKKK
ncbi:RsmB/NOP family class I SAM-dependent RNA methyltransferase [Patescibacteria group bacterium]|nr:RsmB/NOP family class I SAM-dependent RNA methyltransferase [Patescibacteria group bacterium]MBU1721642.1 RsmB/NOP family class I SAM-dependent RNA methyltransferase [Patescibacteria group bacterium]MBU1901647.1 RsmB/NOP family class I SAM-dependent RNA methyltransferase [Patescibacteria group bacterium]